LFKNAFSKRGQSPWNTISFLSFVKDYVWVKFGKGGLDGEYYMEIKLLRFGDWLFNYCPRSPAPLRVRGIGVCVSFFSQCKGIGSRRCKVWTRLKKYHIKL
jgi:hypothetical protein